MTTPTRRAVSYLPGRWAAVVTDGFSLLLDVPLADPLLGRCWDAGGLGGVQGVLDVLADLGGRPAPSFVLVAGDGDGLRLVVSGRAHAEVFVGQAEPVVHGAGSQGGWSDQRLDGVMDLRLVADDPTPFERIAPLPLSTGVVLASYVFTTAAAVPPPAALPDAAAPQPVGDESAPDVDGWIPPPLTQPSKEFPVDERAWAEPSPEASGVFRALPWRSSLPESESEADAGSDEAPMGGSVPDSSHPNATDAMDLGARAPDAPHPDVSHPDVPHPDVPGPSWHDAGLLGSSDAEAGAAAASGSTELPPPPPGLPPEPLPEPVTPFGAEAWAPQAYPADPDPVADASVEAFLPPGYAYPPPAAPAGFEPAQGDDGLPAPPVQAVLCPNGHPNPPHSSGCRICGAPVADQQPITIERPPLGVLRLSTGETVPLDRDVLLGRAPFAVDVRALRLVEVPSPANDISRSHVRITLDDWQVLATDLGSTNGTTVTPPGQPPTELRAHDPFPLQPGSVLALADEAEARFDVT